MRITTAPGSNRPARFARGLLARAGLALAAMSLLPVSALLAPPQVGPARLEVLAPATARVGEPVVVRLVAHGADAVAGLEVTVRHPLAAAQLRSLARPAELAGGLPLGPRETDAGVTFGWAGCGVASCLGMVSGSAELAVLELVPTVAGPLALTVEGVKAVDATGAVVALAVAPARTVAVRAHGAGPAAVTERLPRGAAHDAALGTAGAVAGPPADLSGDARLTPMDATAAALAWTVARETTGPCGALAEPAADRNADGCIDVADVQGLLSTVVPAPAGDLTLAAAVLPSGPVAQTATPTFTVTTTADDADTAGDGRCATAAGACSLRAAISEANRRSGADLIAFAIPGAGPHTIQLNRQLTTVSDATGGLTIDGYTQPGAVRNTSSTVSNAVLQVQVRGAGTDPAAGAFDGLMLTSGDNVVRGLALFNLKLHVRLYGSAADRNVVAGNFVGTDASGTFGYATSVGGNAGVHLQAGASDNVIGGAAPEDRNVVSGTAQKGIGLFDRTTDRNVIRGNLVGLSPDGSRALPNRSHGIDVNFNSSANLIQDNVVSGNIFEGIEISHGAGTNANRVIGNRVGTDAAGTAVRAYTGNGRYGIHADDGVTDTLIEGNIVGGNHGAGIQMFGFNTTRTTVRGNWIGVSPQGTSIGNPSYGVRVTYHPNGNTVGPDNRIANNRTGVTITGDADNDRIRITANAIWGNAGLGIDLHPTGAVNVNDAGDADSGPNDQLNHPVLGEATTGGVRGTACAGCTVEVFAADADTSGHGEGREYLAAATAGSDGSFQVAVPLAPGRAVTATATDAVGNTSEFARNVVVPGAVAVAQDSFSRTVSGGWGAADTGGAWHNASPSYTVDGSAGRATMTSAGASRTQRLTGLAVQDADVTVTVGTDRLANDWGQAVYVLTRSVAAEHDYRVRVRVAGDGTVLLRLIRQNGAQQVLLGGEVVVPGVTGGPGLPLQVRFQAAGAGTTELRAKVWRAGQAEPTPWQVTAADATAELQQPGTVGLKSYLSTSVTNAPVTVSYDNLLVMPLS